MRTDRLQQSINLEGFYQLARVLLRDRELIVPHARVKTLAQVEWRSYKAKGFKGVILDVDNTLTLPYEVKPHAWIKESLAQCQSCFKDNVALYSNSAGLKQYDPMAGQDPKLSYCNATQVSM